MKDNLTQKEKTTTASPTATTDDDSPGSGANHSVRFLVRHPSADLSFLGVLTGMSPNLSWAKGAERRMPSGKLLSGTHPDSLWSHTSRLGHSSPAAAIEQWLVNIERAAEQFEGIKKKKAERSASISIWMDDRTLEMYSALVCLADWQRSESNWELKYSRTGSSNDSGHALVSFESQSSGEMRSIG